MDTWDGLSQQDSACFIVGNSQEESENINDPVHMLEMLPALRQPRLSHSENGKNDTPHEEKDNIDRGAAMSSSSSARKAKPSQRGRQQPGSSGEDSTDGIPPDEPQALGGGGDPPAGPGDGDAGGGGDHAAGGAGAGGGGAGGGGDGDDGDQGDAPPEDSEEEEEHTEQPSSSDSGSVPPLLSVQPSTSTATPPRSLPVHYRGHQRTPTRDDSGYGPSGLVQPPRLNGDSESEGGISEASTAVVSDTEGHGQIIQSRRGNSHGAPTLSPVVSPGGVGGSGSPRGREVPLETSSALSTLSSYASSSSSECAAEASPRKRTVSKRLPMPPAKRTRVDTSSTSSGTDTRTTSTSSSKRSRDTSDDTSHSGDQQGGASRDPGQQEPRDTAGSYAGSSQQDMFSDEPGPSKQGPKDDDLPPVLTPAEHLESLNFSGQHNSPPTHDTIVSLGYVPASQESFSSSVPYLMPTSPTDTSQDTGEFGSERFREALGGVRKVTPKKANSREDRARMPPPRAKKPDEAPANPQPDEPPGSLGSSNGNGKVQDGSSSNSSSLRPASLILPEGQPLGSISYTDSDTWDANGSKPGQEEAEEAGSKKPADSLDVEDSLAEKDKAESQAWGLHLTSTEQQSSDDPEVDFPRLTPVRPKTREEHSQKDLHPSGSPGNDEKEGEETLEEPEIRRMMEDDEEESEDMGLSQDFALHLSQSQHTQRTTQFTQHTQHSQSQYSVGVTSILERLQSSQGEPNVQTQDEEDEEDELKSEEVNTENTQTLVGRHSQKISQKKDSQKMEHSTAHQSMETESEHKRVPPSLTLSMVETQDEENTESSVSLFQLNPPVLTREEDTQQSESLTSSNVFRRARHVRQKQREAPPTLESSEDPFTFTSQPHERLRAYTEASGEKKSPSKSQREDSGQTEEEEEVMLTAIRREPGSKSPVRPTHTLEVETQEDVYTTIKPSADLFSVQETQPDDVETMEEAMEVDTELVQDTQEVEVKQEIDSNPKLDKVDSKEKDDTERSLKTSADSQGRSGYHKSAVSGKSAAGPRSAIVMRSESPEKPPSEVVVEDDMRESRPQEHSSAGHVDSCESGIIPPTNQAQQTSHKRELPKKNRKEMGAPKSTPSRKKHAQTEEEPSTEAVTLRPQDTFRTRQEQNAAPSARQAKGTHSAVIADTTETSGKQAAGREDQKDTVPVATVVEDTGEQAGAHSDVVAKMPVPGTSSAKDTAGARDGGDGSQVGTVLLYTTRTTVIHHIDQMLETRVNGRTVSVKHFDPVVKTVDVIREVHKDHVDDVSPSRSVHSLTSGDLADISSLSKSTSTKTGSAFTSPHNLLSMSSGGPSSGSGSSGRRSELSRTSSAVRLPMVNVHVQTSPMEEFMGRSVESLPGMLASAAERHSEPETSLKRPSVKRTSSSSSSYIRVADLASQNEDTDLGFKRKSVSSNQSSSLFSTSTVSGDGVAPPAPPPLETPPQGSMVKKQKQMFQKPEPPGSTPRSKHAVREADMEGQGAVGAGGMSLDYATELSVRKDFGDKSYRGRGRGRGRTRGRGRGRGRTLVQVSQPTQQDDVFDQAETKQISASASEALTTSEEPRKLEEGMAVFALWRDDDHFYHGKLQQRQPKGDWNMKFADGNVSDVAESDIFPSCLLTVGDDVMAQRRSTLFDNAVVVGSGQRGTMLVYEVQFSDEFRKKIPVAKLCLTREQGEVIRAKFAALREEEVVPPTGDPMTSVERTGPGLTAAQLSHEDLQKPREKAVYAIFTDRHYYPGYLVAEEADSKFTIAYEDGDVHSVRDIFIIHLALLPVGQAVFAERQGEDTSVPGVIIQVFDEMQDDWGYLVEFTDGESERLHRSKVILTHEQAMSLKASTPTLSSTPKISDVTLDNLVAGKRRRHVPTTASPLTVGSDSGTTTPGRGSPSSMTRPTRRILNSTASKKSAKRTLSDIEPAAKSTPTPKRRMVAVEMEADGEAPSPIAFESPVNKRKSARKVKQELFSEVKGPIPTKGSKLFQGYCFLLTHVERTPEQRREDLLRAQSDALDTTSDESNIEEEVIPFDKNHLQDQIEAGGGYVLERFNKDQLKLYSKCFIISDAHQRTLKYFFSLAANVPCVSHVWIRDSCKADDLKDYTNYILPAGVSIENNALIEARQNPVRPLDGMSVVVITKNQRFQTMWSEILETAGCQVHNTTPEAMVSMDVMVTDRQVDDDLLLEALQADVPVVSSEWVIQCLITGRRVSYRAHPRYRHDYVVS